MSLVSAQDLGNLKQEKWVRVNGQISGGINLYHMASQDSLVQPRRLPFSYFSSGNFSVILKGLALPFSYQIFAPLSSRDNRVIRQPFNQFGVSPTYKWLKFHLGWRSMNFSNYTLNGHVFLGAGVEANPGKLRIGAMYGRFLKAVPEDSARQAYNKVSQYPYAAYDRWGYGLKLGFGTSSNYFDLIYFKARDEMKSVSENPKVQLVAPGENAVLGFATRFQILKNLKFDANAALSAVTRDLRGDSFPVEGQVSKLAGILLQPRLSTAVYYAGDASVSYQLKQLTTSVKIQRIMPDFRSFGTYYMQTDLQRITISPQYNHPKGKLMVSASYGKEHDNLAKKKNYQTSRNIGSFILALRPSNKYGASFQLSNYGTTLGAGLVVPNDTVRLNQVTNCMVFAPYYMILGEKTNHTFMYSLTNQTVNDKNKVHSQNYSMTVVNHSVNYSFNHVQSAIRFDIGGFMVTTKLQQGNGSSTGGSFGFGKTFKKYFNSGINVSYSSNQFQQQSDGHTVQFRWNNSYRAGKHHNFSAIINIINNQSKTGAINRSFTETLATITYTYNF